MAKFMLLRLAALVVALAAMVSLTGCFGEEDPSPIQTPNPSVDGGSIDTTSNDAAIGTDTTGDSLVSVGTDAVVEEPKGGCPTSHRPDATVEFPLEGSDGPQFLCLSANSAEEELATMIETLQTAPKYNCSGDYYGSNSFCDIRIDLLVAKDPAASLRIKAWWPDVEDLSPLEADVYCKGSVCEGEITGNLFDGMLKAIRFTFDISTKQITLTLTGEAIETWEYKFDTN